jgi:hypothetical protein
VGQGPFSSTNFFTAPLDSNFPCSYLSSEKKRLMDIFYPPAYFLTANMDKKYPLSGITSRRVVCSSDCLALNICKFNRLI